MLYEISEQVQTLFLSSRQDDIDWNNQGQLLLEMKKMKIDFQACLFKQEDFFMKHQGNKKGRACSKCIRKVDPIAIKRR